MFKVSPSDAMQNAVSYTAEFLLTRGPYALIGYSWVGCTSEERPRPKEWDVDYGDPAGPCKETGNGTAIFERTFAKAKVSWDCNAAKGTIAMAVP